MPRSFIALSLALLLSITACSPPPGEVLQSPAPPTATQASPNNTVETTSPSAESGTDQSDLSPAEQRCPTGTPALAIIVDPEIIEDIRTGLTQFEEDLEQQGFQVIETDAAFDTPVDLRAYLTDLYHTPELCLSGAYLIGDQPRAYQWFRVEFANPDIPPSEQEVLSYQFYTDLDGIFTASEEYKSPGDHFYSYDVHEGDLDWEIWVAILPAYKGDDAQTIQAINHYFEKNHAYRRGQYNLPRAYLEVNEFHSAATQDEHDKVALMLSSGKYAWTPFSDSPDAQIYFNSSSADMTVDQGYRALSEGVADFTVVNGHGSWRNSGSINIDWVESNPVQTVFFRTSGCSAGNLDQNDNFLSSILYSPTSSVLVAWGSTSESGGMGSNSDGFYGHNVAADLSEGKSFGEAILEHVNTPLIFPYADDRELHFSVQIILGDPSLTLFP